MEFVRSTKRSVARLYRTFLPLATIALVGCGGSRNYRLPPPTSTDTGVTAGDVFDVEVVGEEELDGQYRVAENGTIRFPYVGRVRVEGLEAPEVEEALARALAEGGYFRDPQVRVFVQEANSKRINVIGEVQNPGSYPMTSGMTIVDVLSLAGGFTSIARQGSVRVTRREGSDVRSYNVPVDEITSGEQPDFPIQPGDIIYVDQRPF